jgi:HK97 family phage major capsid protein
MPKNVLEMINDLKDDCTVEDFKAVLVAREEETDATIAKKDAELQELNKKMQEIIEASVKFKGQEEEALDPAIKNTRFFKAAASGKIEEVYKYHGIMVRNDQEWKEAEWKVETAAAEKAALGTVLRGDATTGSYLVPAEYESEVFRVALQSSVMMGKVTTVPMAARSMYWPKENAAPSLTWVTDETTAKTETNPTFSQINLVCNTCAAWLTVTDLTIRYSLRTRRRLSVCCVTRPVSRTQWAPARPLFPTSSSTTLSIWKTLYRPQRAKTP